MQNESVPGGRLNYLDASELAERLNVTRKWIQHYTREGIIPAIKVGRKYLYSPEVVDEALKALQG